MDNWVENCNGRLVVPGLGAYRMDKSEADWTVNDITDQIDYSRYYGGAGATFSVVRMFWIIQKDCIMN